MWQRPGSICLVTPAFLMLFVQRANAIAPETQYERARWADVRSGGKK